MDSQPRKAGDNPVSSIADASACFIRGGLVIADLSGWLAANGATAAVLKSLTLVNAPIQTAPRGVIQDPAGSAIGSGSRPAGGGASGAIYAAFPDLMPVPEIAPCAAVFNASKGPGCRVLHSHSPQLSGQPEMATDRNRTLRDIANTYANAMIACDQHAPQLDGHGDQLNLVPVAAGIFGGDFRNRAFAPPHLDPSYTLAALALAASRVQDLHVTLPAMTLYVFNRDVYDAARACLARI
ncbi:MAG: hypothetical protein KDJ29_10295 [Hyphomicrobiales bacterium]|nr:hypothetical protein [Hyphomicrobiales bacterium]